MRKKAAFQVNRVVRLVTTIAAVSALLRFWYRLRRRRDQPGDDPRQSDDERRLPHNYFVPGQISLFVEHSGLSKERIAQIVREEFPLGDDSRLRDAFTSPEWVVTFDQGRQQFSLVLLDLPRMRRSDDLIRLVDDLNARLSERKKASGPSGYEQARQGEAPTPGAREGSANGRPGEPVQPGVLTPSAVTFNWLAGGTGEHNGSGSPGGRPVPPAAGSLKSLGALGLDFWQFAIKQNLTFETLLSKLEGAGQAFEQVLPELGEGVDVYILDTAPCHIDLERAYEKWKDSNPLIASLLRPGADRPLDVEYAGFAHLLHKADFFHPEHNYVMSDHGLFVAGIVHTIAPKAKLHLIEVLNPYGVGTFESIAKGFEFVADRLKAADAKKIVINASLGFEIPPPTREGLAYWQEIDPFWQQFTLDTILALVGPLEQVCALFDPAGRHPYVGTIAAAGNDAKPNKAPPQARIPAAFDSVLGVAALKHDNATPAEYSNIADMPKSDGLATFGGDVAAFQTTITGALADIYSDPQYGIVGAYIGSFPDRRPNKTGWARWAGTSFATPIVSGFVAALMSKGYTFAGALDVLRAVDPGGANETAVGEVVSVLQGNP